MILETLFALSLVVKASLDPSAPPGSGNNTGTELSDPQKNATLLPLIQQATECIVRRVAADPRFRDNLRPGEMNDLIVDSISACSRPVRAMIDTHDRMYGYGSGEAFLLGPYLDVLPAAVAKQVRLKPALR
jgi:hypothetical protein